MRVRKTAVRALPATLMPDGVVPNVSWSGLVQPEPGAEDLVTRLGRLVEPAPEPENQVLTDDARVVRWSGPMFAVFSVILVPWIIYIARSLPARELPPNYDIAWAGFDVLLCLGLAATGYFALRRSRYLSTAAASAAALLVVDAWFDCMTTPGKERLLSFALCGLVELPLAGVCLWLSYHTHQIAARRIVLLQRRHGRFALRESARLNRAPDR